MWLEIINWPGEFKEMTSNVYLSHVNGIIRWWNEHDTGSRPYTSIAFGVKTNSQTASYTATLGDHLLLMDTSSAVLTLTLPTAVGAKGKEYVVMNTGTKALTIATTSTQTINGGTSYILPNKYFNVTLYSDGSNWVAV